MTLLVSHVSSTVILHYTLYRKARGGKNLHEGECFSTPSIDIDFSDIIVCVVVGGGHATHAEFLKKFRLPALTFI